MFYDKLTISSKVFTDGGYMHVVAPVSRTGVQEYLGRELSVDGETLEPNKVYKVYRDESQVFDKDSLQSAARKPITLGHPDTPVTADSWKDVSLGETGDKVLREGDHVVVDFFIRDADVIKHIKEKNINELSVGYSSDLVKSEHKDYDFEQRDIRFNHIAVVPRGRCGESCKIGDSKMTEKVQSITVDGFTFDCNDHAAQAIGKLQAKVSSLQNDVKTLNDSVAEKDMALGAKDAEIAKLKKDAEDSKLSQDDINKLVDAKLELYTLAKDCGATLKDSDDTRSAKLAIIKHVTPSMKVPDDASDDYVNGVFNTVKQSIEQVNASSIFAPTGDASASALTSDAARDAMIKRLQERSNS